MSFTIVLPLLGLIGLVVVFGVTYKKGLIAALIAAGIAFVVFLLLYAAAIYAVANSM
jgi:hypothetical protein